MKKLLSLLLCMLLVCTTLTHAEVPSITATATVSSSRQATISGTVTDDDSKNVLLILGNAHTLLYINDADIIDGRFEFSFKLDDRIPTGEHRYILTTSKSQFIGTLNVPGKSYQASRYMIKSDINLVLEKSIPRVSATIECQPGTKLIFCVKEAYSETTIISKEIDTTNDSAHIDFSLSSLSKYKAYKVTLSAISSEQQAVNIDMSITTSPLEVSFSGPVAVSKDYVLRARIQGIDNNLIAKNLEIYNRTWNTDFKMLNLIPNCSFGVAVDIIEYKSGLTDGSVCHINNPQLYSALKKQIPKLDPDNTGIITPEELSSIKGVLNLGKTGLYSIDGLQNCTGITHLYLNDNQIKDISPLIPLESLKYLNLNGNPIQDVYRLPPYLRYLSMAETRLSDLSGFGLTNTIVHLNLSGNNLLDISNLHGYKALQYFDIRNNSVSDIGPLPAKNYVKILK